MKNLYISEGEKNKILKLHNSFLLNEQDTPNAPANVPKAAETQVAPTNTSSTTNQQQNTGNITIQKLQTKLGVNSDGKLGTGTLGAIQQKLGITPAAPSSTTAKPANTSANTSQPSKVGDPGVVPGAITNQVTVASGSDKGTNTANVNTGQSTAQNPLPIFSQYN